MPHRLPRSARLSLAAVKLSAVASIVVAGLSAPPSSSQPGPGYAGYPVGGPTSQESRFLDARDCSVTGFPDATPASAVVRTAHGRLRHVSFDTGWAVYTRHGAATLVAVCLDEPPRSARGQRSEPPGQER